MNWDGSNIGPIKVEYVNLTPFGHAVTLSDYTTAYIHKYEDLIPLIADEIKPIFGLNKIGRHMCSVDDVPMILSQRHGDTFTCDDETDLGERDIDDIRRCCVFRWCLGFTLNGERDLWQLPDRITSYCERKYTHDITAPPTKIIRRWFRNHSRFEQFIAHIFNGTPISQVRSRIEAIIMQFDPDQIEWINSIHRRLSMYA